MMATRSVRRTPAARRARGFTIIELLVTMVVAGILAMVAVPSFNNAILGNKLAAFSNSYVASLQLARSEAIKRNQLVKLCRSANGTSCADSGNWQQGWIIFNDADNDGTINGTETRVHYQQALPAEFAFTSDNYSISIRGTGLIDAGATMVLCRHASVGSQERAITVGTTGRASVTKTTNASCPTS